MAVFLAFSVVTTASASTTASREMGVLQAVNATRAAHGLRPLRLDPQLRTAARAWSATLLRQNIFTHGDFPGRMAAFHIRGTAGENLAWGTGSYGSPRSIVAAWLRSPEHRANLLNAAYTRIGIGLARGSYQGYGGATIADADFGG